MANTTLNSPLRGLCPAPFYDASKFGLDGCECSTSNPSSLLTAIVVGGRFCAPVEQIRKGLHCCLPCPMTDYLYPPGQSGTWRVASTPTDCYLEFNTWYRVAEALNVAGLICLLFLLISFIVLPAEKTRRHYLSYCLIIAAMFMAVRSFQAPPNFIR